PIAYPTKIATCCHCGSRAALRLDQGRHELSCANCAAPLRNFKALPARVPDRASDRGAVTHQAPLRRSPAARSKPRKCYKPKKRQGWFGRGLRDFAEEVFDVVEDIFD